MLCVATPCWLQNIWNRLFGQMRTPSVGFTAKTTNLSTRIDEMIRQRPIVFGVCVPLVALCCGLLLSALPIALLGHTAAHQSLVSRIIRGQNDLYSYPKRSFAAHAHRQLDATIKAQQHQQSGSMFGSLGLSSLSPTASHEEEDEHSMFDSMLSHVPIVGSLRHTAQQDEIDFRSGLSHAAIKAYMAAQTGAKAAKGIKSWLPFAKSPSRDEAETSRGWMQSLMQLASPRPDQQQDDEGSWRHSIAGQSLARSTLSAVSSITQGKQPKRSFLSSLPFIGSRKPKNKGRLTSQEERDLQRLLELDSQKAQN